MSIEYNPNRYADLHAAYLTLELAYLKLRCMLGLGIMACVDGPLPHEIHAYTEGKLAMILEEHSLLLHEATKRQREEKQHEAAA